MSLTFYFAPHSTAATVEWTLKELQVPYETVVVDLRDDVDKLKKLGPVNPNLKVPVLVHDGVAIFESAAIQIYLGETFGVERGMYPAPGPQRGEALKWLVWTNVSLGEAMGRWLGTTGDLHDAAGRDIDGLMAHFEQALANRPYILGPDASVVDFHLASFVEWMDMVGYDRSRFVSVKPWFERCVARHAGVQKAAA